VHIVDMCIPQWCFPDPERQRRFDEWQSEFIKQHDRLPEIPEMMEWAYQEAKRASRVEIITAGFRAADGTEYPSRRMDPDAVCSICGMKFIEHTPEMHKECAKKAKAGKPL
jgi:hypothetical protein